MSIPIHSPAEIESIKAAAQVARAVLQSALNSCVPGATSSDIDVLVRDLIANAGAEQLFAGLKNGDSQPFTGSCCLCINEQVIHAPPSNRAMIQGDLVTLDVGLRLDGWCADLARGFIVGSDSVSPGTQRVRSLLAASEGATACVIDQLQPGTLWSSIAQAIRSHVASSGFQLVEGFGGHGIGATLHQPPRVGYDPHFTIQNSQDDFVLRPGMVFTVEPIIAEMATDKSPPTQHAPSWATKGDGWTVVLDDGLWACYQERMVAITTQGVEVLDAPVGFK